MKLAVCSQGEGPDSLVDSRFGRCSGFVITDTETGETQYLPNPAISSAHGAGSGAVQALAKTGVRAVCAEHVGPNAYAGLSGVNIDVYRADGMRSVKDAIEAFKLGNLTRHESATTHPGH